MLLCRRFIILPDVNRLSITINGARYPIATQEDPQHVYEMAKELDAAVRELSTGQKSIALNEALVLIALSYLDAYQKEEKTADNLRNQIAEYLEDAAKARMEATEAKREIARLQRTVSSTADKA